MNTFDTPSDPDQYRIKSNTFESVKKDSEIMQELEMLSMTIGIDGRPFHRELKGFDKKYAQRIVYTFAHEQSNDPESTIPIFEIELRDYTTYENANFNQTSADDPMSAYREYIRDLFIDEDKFGRVQGLGLIGKCLKLSQETECILFIKGINRVPNRTQSAFFQLFESPPSMQFDVEGDQRKLTFFVTTDEDSSNEDIERKLASLMIATHSGLD